MAFHIGPHLVGVPDVTHFDLTMIVEPGFEFITKQIGEFAAALANLDPLWAAIEPIMVDVEERQFDTEGDGTWPPLADSTLAQKDYYGWPQDPLVRTGDLKDSLINPGRAVDRGPRHMAWGTDVAYAPFFQEGTSRMPQRQVIPDPFLVEDRRKIESAMIGYINAASRSTFGRIQPGAGPPTIHKMHFDVNLRGWKERYEELWWRQEIEKWTIRFVLSRGL